MGEERRKTGTDYTTRFETYGERYVVTRIASEYRVRGKREVMRHGVQEARDTGGRRQSFYVQT